MTAVHNSVISAGYSEAAEEVMHQSLEAEVVLGALGWCPRFYKLYILFILFIAYRLVVQILHYNNPIYILVNTKYMCKVMKK